MPAMSPAHSSAPVHSGYGAPPAAGGGFFAGPAQAARSAPVPPALAPNHPGQAGGAGGELKLAQPGQAQTRSRSGPAFSATPAASAPSRKPAPAAEPRRAVRAAQPESIPATSPKARAAKHPAATAEKAPSRAGEIFTGLFVVVGAGVGAFLAWVVMTVL
jgi:hypothetical protein